VLQCAHGNKETKTSLLSSQEVFGVGNNSAAHKEGCVKGIQASGQIQSAEKQG